MINMNKIHLMNIKNLKVFDKFKNIIHEESNIKNTLHKQGEEFLLKSIFYDKTIIPENFYIGLDTRPTISRTDTLRQIIGEPSFNNYSRQIISHGNWSVVEDSNTVYLAKSGTIVFSAVSSTEVGWGPVSNIFLTTTNERCTPSSVNCPGYLISSAKLSDNISLNSGESVVIEMSISLYN